MSFIINNWMLILALAAGIGVGVYSAYIFIKKPANEQINDIKQWLLWAMTEAEKTLGSGTGKIKLRYVYDMFLTKFPQAANWITFEKFSELVTQTMEEFNHLLETNGNLKRYIEGETE